MDSNVMLENMYDELVENIKSYHPVSDDITIIRKAFEVAREAHDGQVRKSGEPFFIHPIQVAIILAELKLDKETIVAALLHDVVEDTSVTKEDIERIFGKEVAFLVDGVTKLTQISTELSKAERKQESFRKLILATAEDIRVIIIKLADRVHNMRTLQFQKPYKQIEISNETMDIYCPIAQRLGISVLSTELEDLSFSYLFPKEYKEILSKISLVEQEKGMESTIEEIKEKLNQADIAFQIRYEMKHLFSIYRKMVNRHKTIEEMYDIGAIKIIVNSVEECYLILGILHNFYTPIPNRFKDYIAMPKENRYQSLHTTVISKTGKRFEVQIKTKEMDLVAKFGVLSHWKYGESGVDAKSISKSQREKSIWLKQILEWQQEITNNSEFMDLVKDDLNLFSEKISCFTPKGDVKNLQKGSTVVDFAYAVHTDIGNKVIGALVNGKKRAVDYVLNTGDFVEIITSEGITGPRKDWLEFVKTSNARNKIKHWYRDQSLLSKMDRIILPKKIQEVVPVDIVMEEGRQADKFAGLMEYLIKREMELESFRYDSVENILHVNIVMKRDKTLKELLTDIQKVQGVVHVGQRKWR